MDAAQLDNPNPTVASTLSHPRRGAGTSLSERVFDVIRDIRDPEHPHTLEELSVVTPSSVKVTAAAQGRKYGRICVEFEPTVPHCSLASVIGLSIIQKMRLSDLLKENPSILSLLSTCIENLPS